MSPLLFALSSQPLMGFSMGLLESKIQLDELVGLRIPDQRSLVYQLFTDNAGIFLQNSKTEFEIACAAIHTYETISGAFLNVGKSVIVPLLNPQPQDWFVDVGFKVLQPGESTIYLGCLIGFHVSPTQEIDFLIGKVCKRLSHWANWSLSFAGRSVLLRHVICAMPIYHLMTISLNTQGFKELEGISRDLLWGMNELGDLKKPLVAWADTTLYKVEGGVGIENLHSTSLTFKMRWCTRLCTDEDSAWVLLAQVGISRSLDSSFHRHLRCRWTIAKAFLLTRRCISRVLLYCAICSMVSTWPVRDSNSML